MNDKLEEEINLYDKIIVKNYNDLSLAEQFKKGAVVKVDDELTILKQQLAIAVEALEKIKKMTSPPCYIPDFEQQYIWASLALQQIKELAK